MKKRSLKKPVSPKPVSVPDETVSLPQEAPSESRVSTTVSSGWFKATRIPALMTCAIIALSACGLYLGAMHHEPVLDDRDYVLNNPLLDDAGSFLYPFDFVEFANGARARGMDPDFSLNFITRPVTYLTFYANRLAGGTSVSGYRAVNVLIHACNGMLLFGILALLAREARGSSRVWPSALAAILFTAHPMATQAVTYITQRFESLATTFILASIGCHLIAVSRAHGARDRRGWRVASVLLCLGAMLSKETGFVTPILAIMLDWLWLGTPIHAALRRGWRLIPTLVLVPALVLATNRAHQGDDFSLWTALNVTNIGGVFFHPWHYFLTQVSVSMDYLGLWVFPAGQTFVHDVDLVESMTSPRFAGSLVLILAVIALAVLAFRKWKRPLGGMVLGGTLWYFLALAPSSSFVPLPELMSEHRAYLPGVGLFIVVAAVLARIEEVLRPAWLRMVRGAFAAAAVALGVATLERNEVLRTEEGVDRDAVAKSPDRARSWNGLGVALARKKQLDDALHHFRKACALRPTWVQPWENRCIVRAQKGDYDGAIDVIAQASREGIVSIHLLYVQGVSFAGIGRLDEAVERFKKVVHISPAHKSAYVCLAAIYYGAGRREEAFSHYRQAIKLGPLDAWERDTLAPLIGELSAMAEATNGSP